MSSVGASIGEKLSNAINNHKHRKFEAAEKLYKEILSLDQNHAEAIELFKQTFWRSSVLPEPHGRKLQLAPNLAL